MRRFPLVIALIAIVLYLHVPDRAIQCVASLIFITICVSFIYMRILSNAVTVQRLAREFRIARFERQELLLYLENRSFLPIALCYVADTPGTLSIAADDGRWVQSLRPRERIIARYQVLGNERGEYRVGPIHLTMHDPLGLFSLTREIDDYCTVMVRPARIGPGISLNEGIPQGSIVVRDPRYEDMTLYRSVRDYAPGDEMKRINWKSSARHGKLYTNEFESSLNCPTFVFLDLVGDHYPVKQRYAIAESVIERAAAIVRLASVERQHCGFASTGLVEEGPTDAPNPEMPEPAGPSPRVQPFVAAGPARGDYILDVLSKIRLSVDRPTDDASLLVRSLSTLPSGGRLYYAGPSRPDIPPGMGIRFVQIAEFAYEAVR